MHGVHFAMLQRSLRHHKMCVHACVDAANMATNILLLNLGHWMERKGRVLGPEVNQAKGSGT